LETYGSGRRANVLSIFSERLSKCLTSWNAKCPGTIQMSTQRDGVEHEDLGTQRYEGSLKAIPLKAISLDQ